uniref:DUF1336 domain-containing protein n=1 Tax=Steinernema glaseri TaxID=37863 RepID=A0A1I8ADA2_9BILA
PWIDSCGWLVQKKDVRHPHKGDPKTQASLVSSTKCIHLCTSPSKQNEPVSLYLPLCVDPYSDGANHGVDDPWYRVLGNSSESREHEERLFSAHLLYNRVELRTVADMGPSFAPSTSDTVAVDEGFTTGHRILAS